MLTCHTELIIQRTELIINTELKIQLCVVSLGYVAISQVTRDCEFERISVIEMDTSIDNMDW